MDKGKKYLIDDKRDEFIFSEINKLEKRKLNQSDASLVKLIKSQLEADWRAQLIKEINKLLKKYKK